MEGFEQNVADEDWLLRAACRGEDTELFYVPDSERGAAKARRVAAAKAICAQCVVRIGCLEYALRTDSKYGIWGGMTEEEREQLKKRRAKQEARKAAEIKRRAEERLRSERQSGWAS